MTNRSPSGSSSVPSLDRHAQRGDKSFTLVELMAVLLIAVILTGLAIPAITSMLQNLNLSQAGQTLSSQINLATQIAASRGYPVEVRLIQSPSSTATPYYYSAIQLYSTTGGTAVPVNHVVVMPPSAVISGATTTATPLSPYLTNLQTGTFPTMAYAGTTCKYVSFRISSQGLLSPYPTAGFAFAYLTVIPLSQASNTTVPSNFITVQVNPSTGMQLVYKP